MENDKTENLLEKNPSRDDKAEQEARGKEDKQEAEQLPELHRQNEVLTPATWAAIAGAYFGCVACLTGIGMFANTIGHNTIRQIYFIACLVLSAIPPIVLIWYLSTRFRKKSAKKAVSGKQSRLERIMSFTAIKFWARLGNNIVFRLFGLAMCVYTIADAIRTFPLHPRTSLIIIVFSWTLFIVSLASLIVNLLLKETNDLWKTIVHINANIDVLNSSSEQHLNISEKIANVAFRNAELTQDSSDLMLAQSEVQKLTTAALRELDNTLKVSVAPENITPIEPDSESEEERT